MNDIITYYDEAIWHILSYFEMHYWIIETA